MARYEEARNYPNKSADDCYKAGEIALKTAGFDVWKTRPFAWLLLSKRQEGIDTLNANMMARPGALVTLSIGGDRTPEDVLKNYAQKIFTAFEEKLGSRSSK